MFYRLRNYVNSTCYNVMCRGVLDSASHVSQEGSLVIASMLGKASVLPYLVAVKTLLRRLERGKVVILDDGTLRAEDKQRVTSHLPGVTLRHISDINVGRCPRGGCWERIHMIGELAEDNYVIQLDSDTVTLGEIPEVVECIDRNVSFTLNSEDCGNVESAEDAALRAHGKAGAQVQLVAERMLPVVPEMRGLRYVRGCAGFAGFAPGSLSRGFLERVSVCMEKSIGSRWREWGSEQFMSNVVIANADGARVLPFPKYASFMPELNFDYDSSVFLHYFGTYRYREGRYIRDSRRAIKELSTSEAVS